MRTWPLTLALTLFVLSLGTYLLSFFNLGIYHQTTRGHERVSTKVALANGRILYQEQENRVQLDHGWRELRWFDAHRSAPGQGFPLYRIVAGAAALTVVCYLVPWSLCRRRIRSKRCVNCGYSREGQGNRCPECGVDWTETLSAWPLALRPGSNLFTSVVGPAAVICCVLFFAAMALSYPLAVSRNRMARVQPLFHFVTSHILNQAVPRISPEVYSVGARGAYPNLDELPPTSGIVLLDGGKYSPEPKRWRGDYVIVGAPGSVVEFTNPKWSLRGRSVLMGLEIDCDNRQIDVEGGLYAIGCTFRMYNSGAGGSEGLSGDGAFWLEDCLFNGREGRAMRQGRNTFGNALDIDGLLYCRGTRFIDNQYIIRRHRAAVVDRCEQRRGDDGASNHYLEREVFFRGSRSFTMHSRARSTLKMFAHATDDLAFVEFVLGRRPAPDELSVELATTFNFRKDAYYWASLLLCRDKRVRDLAAATLSEEFPRIPPRPVSPFENAASAFQAWHISDEPRRRQALLFLVNGDSSVDALIADILAESPDIESSRAIRAWEIDQLRNMDPPASAFFEYSRVMEALDTLE